MLIEKQCGMQALKCAFLIECYMFDIVSYFDMVCQRLEWKIYSYKMADALSLYVNKFKRAVNFSMLLVDLC